MKAGVDTFVSASLPAHSKPHGAGNATEFFNLRAWAWRQAWQPNSTRCYPRKKQPTSQDASCHKA